jgi:O-antigen/teichoic acid export membrane protein
MKNISSERTITQKAAQSVKWSAMMEMVSRTASPIIMVILARLLTPEDFGVVAMSMIAISFAQMFWDAGLSKALIQTNEVPEEAAHIVFWTNLVLGIIVYIFLFMAAPWGAVFFKSPGSVLVMRVLGLQIIIASLSSVQQALFERELNFRSLFWIKLTTAFLPGLFSIPLAIYGYGVWALVGGSLAGQLINLILLWRKSHWRPSLKYNFPLAKKIFGFGSWILAQSFASWLIMWSDSIIVGRFLGAHDLGVYRAGWTMVITIFGLMVQPFAPVLYPALSRLQGNLPALKETFHKANKIIISLVIPTGVGLWFVGTEAADLLFGNKWVGLGFVLRYIGLREAISWTFSLNGEVCRAMGRPEVFAKLDYTFLLWIIPTYFFAAKLGLETFVYARVAVTIIGLLFYCYIFHRVLSISPFYLWYQGKEIFISAFLMGVAMWIIKTILYFFSTPKLMIFAFLIVFGTTIYIGILWFLNRDFIIKTYQLIKQSVAK